MTKLKILTFLCALPLAYNSYSQSTCATATQINNLPYTTPGLLASETTCGAGNNYTKADKCGNRYMGGEEFMYEYTPANNQCINLRVTPSGIGNDTPTALFVTEGCPDDPNGKCLAQVINITNDALPKPSILNNLQLEAGKTYYFQVTSENECFQFTFDASAGNACAPDPVGYDCDDADEITALPYSYSGTTCNKTSILNEGNECYSTFYAGTAYIFKYEPKKDICIEITGNAVDRTTRFSMHNECPTLTDTTCLNSSYFYTFGPRTYYETLDSGQTYYFVANTTSTAPGCGEYNFTIREISDEGTTCALAYDLMAPTTTFTQQTTQCKGNFYNEEEQCSNFYDGGNEVLYKFEAKGNECVVASAVNMTSYGSLQLFQGCPMNDNSNRLAIDDRCGFRDPNSVTIEYTFSTPGTYYFVVAGRFRDFSFGPRFYDFNYDFQFSATEKNDLGKDCANADTLSSSLPNRKNNLSIQCKGDDYQEADGCNSLMNGADYVMVYTAPNDFCGSVVARNTSGNGGITLMSECPSSPTSQCLGSVLCPSLNCDSIYLDYTFEKGETYYIIASGNGGNFFNFDIEVKKSFFSLNGCQPCEGSACVDCENANFEKSSLLNWTGNNGTYANPGQNAGFIDGAINQISSRHTIMNAGLDDPIVGQLLKTTGPLGGRYSMRLGNQYDGREGEQISFDINVTNETKNFFYYYAVVFEDPGNSHDETDQPFFGVEMLDASGNEIACASYQVRSSNAEGFEETPPLDGDHTITEPTVIYKDWSLVAVPLDNYIGQTVSITFTATDCGLGAHMGYAYIDAFCGDLDIEATGGNGVLCPGESVTLKAPDGFADYTWSTGATTQEITVNTAGNYSVLLTPFSENPLLDCRITLDYEVKTSPNPVADYNFDPGCNDEFIDFFSTSTGGGPGINLSSATWDFGDGTSSTEDTVNHKFPGPGTYTVVLNVVNENGCEASISQDITIDPFTTLPPLNAKDSIFTCLEYQVKFTSDLINDASYDWTGPQGFSNISNNFDFLPTDLNQSGWYYLEATSTNDPCVKAYDSTYLHLEAIPELSIMMDTTICFSDSIFEVYANGDENTSYQWLPSNNYQSPNASKSFTSIPKSDSVHVMFSFPLCPDSVLGAFITVNNPDELLSPINDTAICEGMPFELKATALPVDYLMWITPSGDSLFENPLIIDTARAEHNGDYKVIAYLDDNFYCPFDSATVNVDVMMNPNISFNVSPQNACPGSSIMLSASGASSYSWTDSIGNVISNSNSFSNIFANTQYIYVDAIASNSCTTYDSVEVSVLPDFDVDLGPNLNRCKGDNATISVNTSDFYATPSNYLWNTGETTKDITVSDEGYYKVDVTINGCVKSDSVYLKIQDPASFSLGNDTLLCQGETISIDLTGFSGTVNWSDGDNSKLKTFSYPGGNYSVEITNGLCILNDEININFQDLHSVTPRQNDVVCEGQILNYTGDTPGNNRWKVNGKDSLQNSITLSDAGSYNIELYNTQGVCTASTSFTANIQAKPAKALAPSYIMCPGGSVSVDATIAGAIYYLWDDGNTSANRTFSSTGIKIVEIQVGACIVYDTTNIIEQAIPIPDLGPDIQQCSNQQVQLINNTSGTNTVTWFYNGTQISNNPNSIVASNTGEYVIEVGQGNCTERDTIQVTIDQLPVFDLGNDTILCPQQSLTVTTTYPSYNTLWNDGVTTSTRTITNAGTYTVDVTNGTCTVSDQIIVDFANVQIPNLGPDTNLCQGQSIILNSNTSAFDSILWNTGEKTPTIAASTSSNYYVDVYFNQCKTTDTISVNILQYPNFDLGSDIKVCDATPVSIGTKINLPHLWNTGSTSQTIQPTTSGNYSLTVSNMHCSFTDNININFVTPPVVDLGPDLLRCDGESDVLSGPVGNYTYTWNGAVENQTKTISKTGQYVLSVTDGYCVVNDTMFAEYTIPNDPLLPSGHICSVDSFTLNASVNDAVNYTWNTGETSSSITVKNEGTYFVDITQGGCVTRFSSTLKVTQEPVLELGDDIEVCASEIVKLNTNLPDLNNNWNTGETVNEITVIKPNTYIATVSDGPCVVKDTIKVLHNPLPRVPESNYKVCPKDSLLLDFSSYATSILWNDGYTGLTRIVYSGQEFALILENEFSCINKADILVNLDYNCPDALFVPSAFTPDGDGINDVFKPVTRDVEILNFSIYDRWGEQLYYSIDKNPSWDGIYNIEKAQLGLYIWQIEYIDTYGNTQKETGKVNLLR